jgi:hypothetical protein
MALPDGLLPFIADGVNFPEQVTDFKILTVPARSTNTAANLYVQVAGVANFSVDPKWETADGGHEIYSGDLTVTMPLPVLQQGDTLVEWTALAGMQRLDRDEEGSTDDFFIAVKKVTSVRTAAGDVRLTMQAEYQGDVWVLAVSFLLDLLIYRPSLDTVSQSVSQSGLPNWARNSSVLLKNVGNVGNAGR